MDMNDNILQNTGVIITRPIDQSYSLINAIKQHGGSPIPFPVLSIKPLKNSIIESNVKKLFNTSIIIFISSNAAKYGIDHINLTDKKIIAIGPTTRKYLEDNKINVPGGYLNLARVYSYENSYKNLIYVPGGDQTMIRVYH